MNPNRQIFVLIFLFVMFSFSCNKSNIDQGEVNKLRPDINENANSNVDPNANVAEDNETELNSLINLPFEPSENVYREDFVKGSKDKRKVTAVLKFSEDDVRSLLEQLESKSKPFATKLETEPWFPAELIAKSQTSGDESIKGISYNAESFFKPPFNSGSLTRVNDTDYFVLTLQAK